MKTVSIDDVVVGSSLQEPIYINDVLLCKKNTPISINLKNALKKLGIKKLKVNTIFTEKIDKSKLNVLTLNNFTCIAVQRLDIDDVMICSKTLVQSILEDKYYSILSAFFNGDPTTRKHSINVANLAVTVAFKVGMQPSELRTIAVGSLLHDIGKTGLKLNLINKEGKLTDDEMELIRQHPRIGYDMLRESKIVTRAERKIVLQHHERWDGKGYPTELYGTNTYRLARLVHICDVYEAMCAKRPYKEPIPRHIVRKEMIEGSGTSFDPKLLRIFLKTIPMYTIGEEIICNGRLGIVCDNSNPEDPIVFHNNSLYRLSDFEVVSEEREALLRVVLSTLR